MVVGNLKITHKCPTFIPDQLRPRPKSACCRCPQGIACPWGKRELRKQLRSLERYGHYLPPNSPPPPNPSPLPGNYGPYESRAAFELTEFLYSHKQMSATKINELLAIMASMYDNDPPFCSHRDMYDTIDATRHGDSPWQLFSVTYSGVMPDDPLLGWLPSMIYGSLTWR